MLVTNCTIAGLNIYQEGNLLMFESCLFSSNKGSGIIQYSGSTNMFMKYSIENNGNYGVLLTYQQDPLFKRAPYVETSTGLLTFMSCYFETNGTSAPQRYSNITMIGQPDPGYLKVRNVIVKGCHFGLGKGERAIDLKSDVEHVTIEDNLFAYVAEGGITPIVIGSFYSDDVKRVNSNINFRNNYYHWKSSIEIPSASPEASKNMVADLLGLVQRTTISLKGITMTVLKSGKVATVYIKGTSSSKIEQNVNFSATGILMATDEKIQLSTYEQNDFLFETRSLKEGNIIRFECAAGKKFNNVAITVPTQF